MITLDHKNNKQIKNKLQNEKLQIKNKSKKRLSPENKSLNKDN